MDKIDWKKKLTSRKFWLAVAGFVAGVVILIFNNNELANEISALVLSAASVIAYIIGEGLADAAYNQANIKSVNVTSYVDGNENFNEDVLALRETIIPDTTGRDGITIDGNADED